MLFSVKTVVGRENIVIESISSKAQTEKLNIQSLIHPEEIKGYIFIEGDIRDIEKAIQLVPHVRGLIKAPIDMAQIKRFLEPKTVEIELNNGDTIEVIGGPFKGTKGRVTRYDKTKREITIEPLEVPVPIPVTISVEFVKLLVRAKK